VSKRNAQVMQVLAGAAALAGFGYTLARRSGARARSARAGLARRAEVEPTRVERVESTEPAAWDEAARISSAPDALDVALDLDGLFDGELESGVQPTVRAIDHVPPPRTGDDEEAPSPDDLGRAFLTHATESEHSTTDEDLLPDLESLPRAIDELGIEEDSDAEAEPEMAEGEKGDDETIREYVRRHRISSMG
jgi:hypothetical protein